MAPPPPRYRLGRRLGRGGAADVLRAVDGSLGREVALKVMRADVAEDQEARLRFVLEAEATAQLQHPGIVPIHDRGVLPDGRPFFTMREVRGNTLAEHTRAVHAASGPEGWGVAPGGWSLRRLLGAFVQVTETVAYAHSRGVVHRDLKPDNVMTGPFGEVLVLDWGLAHVGRGGPETVRDSLAARRAFETLHGSVAGTPAYMPPEQARGETDRVGPASDVYTLGATLYEILAGVPPYSGDDAQDVLLDLLDAPPPPPSARARPPVPPELEALCLMAMARRVEDRTLTAAELGACVRDWLDGAHARDRALTLVAAAREREEESVAQRQEAQELREAAAAALALVPPWAEVAEKAPYWAVEDRAAAEELGAERKDQDAESLLHAALSHAPGLPEAHAALARRARDRHARAEETGDAETARAQRRRMLDHLASLAPAHPDAAPLRHYLDGAGALTLHTYPPGADVEILRYELRARRLVPVPIGRFARTPLDAMPLPMGSYLVRLRLPGFHEVRYPVRIDRLAHWDGVAPGDSAPTPIALPPLGELAPDERYVPPGPFRAGGDPEIPEALPASRPWVPGFIVGVHPVTNAEYLAFLDALERAGDAQRAWSAAPRPGRAGVPLAASVFVRDAGGTWSLGADADGHAWTPDQPVRLVDADAAFAFAAWRAARTERPWRVPVELELEKAARGVDGRLYPWGDHMDPSWTCMRQSHRSRARPRDVHALPDDVSPYGVVGLAGNCAAWTASPWRAEVPARVDPLARHDEPMLVFRGGSFTAGPRLCRVTARAAEHRPARSPVIGVRLVRSWG